MFEVGGGEEGERGEEQTREGPPYTKCSTGRDSKQSKDSPESAAIFVLRDAGHVQLCPGDTGQQSANLNLEGGGKGGA